MCYLVMNKIWSKYGKHLQNHTHAKYTLRRLMENLAQTTSLRSEWWLQGEEIADSSISLSYDNVEDKSLSREGGLKSALSDTSEGVGDCNFEMSSTVAGPARGCRFRRSRTLKIRSIRSGIRKGFERTSSCKCPKLDYCSVEAMKSEIRNLPCQLQEPYQAAPVGHSL